MAWCPRGALKPEGAWGVLETPGHSCSPAHRIVSWHLSPVRMVFLRSDCCGTSLSRSLAAGAAALTAMQVDVLEDELADRTALELHMDLMLLVKGALLDLVEGLTEFLPISSTGHSILASSLLRFDYQAARVFEITIQAGATLAVVWHYRARLTATVPRLVPILRVGGARSICWSPSCRRPSLDGCSGSSLRVTCSTRTPWPSRSCLGAR